MNFTVQLREKTGKESNKKLRKDGFTPGIIYGIKDPLPVSMKTEKAMRFIQSMHGATKVFNLTVETGEKSEEIKVILQDYQMSNLGGKLVHTDFLEVTENTQIHFEIPITIVNEEICPGIEEGGVLQIVRRSIPVKCAVKNIQETIEVDVKDLQFGESIHVLDLDYKEGVEPVVYGRNFTIITVAGRIEEEVEAEEELLEGEVAGEVAAGDEEEKPEAEEE